MEEGDFPNEYVPAVTWPLGYFEVAPEIENVWIDNVPARVENGRVWVDNLTIGWHQLKVRRGDSIEDRGRALYVTPFGPDNFFWVFVTDVHIARFGKYLREVAENGFKLINEIGPAFVFCGGDVTDYALDSEYEGFLKCRKSLELPLYMIPGNHETYIDPDLDHWSEMFGPTDYSVKFGDALFVAANVLGPYRSWGGATREDLEWIDNQLSRDGKIKFFLNHLPVVYSQTTIYTIFPLINRGEYNTCVCRGTEELLEILRRENAISVFGHWHVFDEPFVYENLLFFHVPSLTPNSKGGLIRWLLGGGMMAGGYGFYIFRVENWKLTYAHPIDIRKLEIVREKASDSVVVVRIRNDHPYPVPLNLKFDFRCGASIDGKPVSCVTYGQVSWVRFDAPSGLTTLTVRRI